MAVHLGTGVQMAALGPENSFLDLNPEVTPWYRKTTQCTPHAQEPRVYSPLQPAKFGATATYEIPHDGDLLGDMHLDVVVPAVQEPLGVLTSLPLYAFLRTSFVGVSTPTTHTVSGQLVSVSLQEYKPAFKFRSTLVVGGVQWYMGASNGGDWRVVILDSGRVVSTLTTGSSAPRLLSVETPSATFTYVQQPGSSVAVHVRPDGSIVSANDHWRSPLGYALMRRARFSVEDVQVHNHERQWYDLSDRLSIPDGLAGGLAAMLGTDLSMGRPHRVLVPLKFMCCGTTRMPRAHFPLVLVPHSRVVVELELEALQACTEDVSVPTTPPESMEVRLVVEHVWLGASERTTMQLKSEATLMYQTVQDMDGVNYVETGDGGVVRRPEVRVDLSELNLPVSALVWVVYQECVPRLFDYLDAVEEGSLFFGSVERVAEPGRTFTRQQAWSHAPRVPTSNVHLYSFGLDLAEPSGIVDFSVLQKPTLRVRLRRSVSSSLQVKCKVWGLAYNWLVFRGGRVAKLIDA
jgi:hypothetical protein